MTSIRVFTLLLVASVLIGCAPADAFKSTSTSPAASTSITEVPDTDGVVVRFTNDIWPAINDFNAASLIGSPQDAKLAKVIDAEYEVRSKLWSTVPKLGTLRENGADSMGAYRDNAGLSLARASLISLSPSSAVLDVCYTYTADTFPDNDVKHPVPQPAASEVTVELNRTNNWYLRAISNDHVVPSCPSSKT